MVPVASWVRVWSTRIAISVPGASSPETRWSARILRVRFWPNSTPPWGDVRRLGEALQVRRQVELLAFRLELADRLAEDGALFLIEDAKVHLLLAQSHGDRGLQVVSIPIGRQLFDVLVVVVVRIQELGAGALHVNEGEARGLNT